MEVDQDVIKITTGTAVTTCHNSLNPMVNIKKDVQNDDLIVIDPESSESSSSNESDVEVIDHYKLNDIRPVIGKYGKCSFYVENIYFFSTLFCESYD